MRRVHRVADGLALAATPGFALMALFGAQGGAVERLCGGSPLAGMATMYLLMSLVHAGPWLRLWAQASRSPRPIDARACSDSDETTG